jgi:hypothetical protein
MGDQQIEVLKGLKVGSYRLTRPDVQFLFPRGPDVVSRFFEMA